ncbi:MAG: chloride channel protein [Thermoguttaceae bacterium]
MDRFKKYYQRFDWDASGRLLFYSAVVGVMTGLAAALFFEGFLIVESSVSRMYHSAGIEFPQPNSDYTAKSGPGFGEAFLNAERHDILPGGLIVPRYWILILLIPTCGGLVCGFLVWSFAPEVTNEGTDTVIRTFHNRNGLLRARISIVKILAGFFSLGSGGSAGWEGPITLCGAGIASNFAQYLRLSVKDRRILFLSGAAGGIGAIFQIPLGGGFFIAEVLYATSAIEFTAIFPCVVASFIGFATFRLCHGGQTLLDLSSNGGIHQLFESHPISDMTIFLAFVPFVALAALFYIVLLRFLRNKIFRNLSIPEFIKPALGGLLLGCIALVFPQVFGSGSAWIQRLVEGQLPFYLILILLVPKMLGTALTVSSGGSGGLFVPSLLIGGLIGGILGHVANSICNALGCPELAPQIPAAVLVGMSMFYAGVAKVPLASALIVCELIGCDYTLLIPFFLLNLAHFAVQSSSQSIYEEQVLAPIDSEAHFGNYSIDLLKSLSVKDVCFDVSGSSHPFMTIPASATMPQTVRRIASNPDSLFPVIDDAEKFLGVLQSSDVWTVSRSQKKWLIVTAADLMQNLDIAVSPSDTLYQALRLCTLWQISEIPVIDASDPTHLLGVIRKCDIISAYNARLAMCQWN